MSTANRNNRILVVDDNPAIHEDFRKILGNAPRADEAMVEASKALFGKVPAGDQRIVFEVDSAFQGEEGLLKVKAAAAATRPYAVAFVDVRMPPGWDGVETITRIWREHPELQVVICTAYSDYSWEEMIRRLGVSDNLVVLKKPFDTIEVVQLACALTEKWTLNREVKSRLQDLDHLVAQRTAELQQVNEQLRQEITERVAMEKALRLSEDRFAKAFKASPIPLAMQTLREEVFVDVNQGFLDLTGLGRAELIGRTGEEVGLWADPAEKVAMLRRLREQMCVRNMACRLRAKSAQVRDVLLSVELFELDGEPFLLVIAQDITDLVKMENQLRQTQKLEALGQLASGVAHDFNNLLTVIQGNAGVLLANQPPQSAEVKPLQTICAAADRAAKLVRQLLAFSRKQFFQPRSLDLKPKLKEFADMLPTILGSHIQVEFQCHPNLPLIAADPELLEQLLMNLAVNARDAMANGGVLKLTAEEVTLSPEAAQANPEARPGRFARLAITDTGCGMSKEVLPHVFEPFFTTKPLGKGVGLGLATVYGIARQHQGWVEVCSQPGQGATFSVFLPAAASDVAAVPASWTEPTLRGRETVLVVEDECEVRDFVAGILRANGYAVLQATSGPQALGLWAKERTRVDLLLTDLALPGGLTGRELAERLLTDRPALKVLYTSAYSPGLTGPDFALFKGRVFLPKPYRPAQLLRQVRDCLDAPKPA